MYTHTHTQLCKPDFQTTRNKIYPEGGDSLTVLDHADEGDDGQQDNIAQGFVIHVCFRLPARTSQLRGTPGPHCAGRGSEGRTLPFIIRISKGPSTITGLLLLLLLFFFKLATKVPWLSVSCQKKQGSGERQEGKKK